MYTDASIYGLPSRNYLLWLLLAAQSIYKKIVEKRCTACNILDYTTLNQSKMTVSSRYVENIPGLLFLKLRESSKFRKMRFGKD